MHMSTSKHIRDSFVHALVHAWMTTRTCTVCTCTYPVRISCLFPIRIDVLTDSLLIDPHCTMRLIVSEGKDGDQIRVDGDPIRVEKDGQPIHVGREGDIEKVTLEEVAREERQAQQRKYMIDERRDCEWLPSVVKGDRN